MKTLEQRIKILENRVSNKRNLRESDISERDKESLAQCYKELGSFRIKWVKTFSVFGIRSDLDKLTNTIEDKLEEYNISLKY